MAIDLRPMVEAADPPARIAIHYPPDSWRDSAHATHLAGAPGLELCPLAGSGQHNPLPAMLADGSFDRGLDELLG